MTGPTEPNRLAHDSLAVKIAQVEFAKHQRRGRRGFEPRRDHILVVDRQF